jgi:transposase-like protein
VHADHVTVWRWVQRYAPELQRCLRRHLKPTNDSWRMDETYVRVKGKWRYLYRAVDSTGATLDFLLSAKQDAAAAKRFLAKALGRANHPAPRVINTDGHAAYPSAVAQLKGEGDLTEDLSGARAHGSRIHEPENMSQSIPKNVRPANSGSLRAGNITTFYNAVSSKRPCLMINQKPFVLD